MDEPLFPPLKPVCPVCQSADLRQIGCKTVCGNCRNLIENCCGD